MVMCAKSVSFMDICFHKLLTMRFTNTPKVFAECMFKYYTILWCIRASWLGTAAQDHFKLGGGTAFCLAVLSGHGLLQDDALCHEYQHLWATNSSVSHLRLVGFIVLLSEIPRGLQLHCDC